MERHRCKLCSRSFGNGRALGGHMKSHLKAFQPTRKRPGQSPTESASSSSPENRGIEEKCAVYALRENPKRSCRVADPEFSVMDSGSVVQEGRVSETEPKARARKSAKEDERLKIRSNWTESTESPEPASSISDTTPEVDVAVCLMMLSRDVWKGRKVVPQKGQYPEEENEEISTTRNLHKNARPGTACQMGAFQCPICYKVFTSGQALGGHKRSHTAKDSPVRHTSNSSRPSTILLIDLNLPAPLEDPKLEQCF